MKNATRPDSPRLAPPGASPLAVLALLASLLGLTACGGSTERDTEYGWTLITNLEGYVASDVPQGGVTAQAFAAPPVEVGEAAGTPASSRRALYRFDLTPIPFGFRVVRAEIHFTQYQVTGDPYGRLGALVVDHVEPGAGLDAGDFDGGTLQTDVGVLSTDGDLEGKWLDVTGQVQADIDAPRSTSSFRLRFQSDDDGTPAGNSVRLSDSYGNPDATSWPFLLVELERV